MQQHSARVYYRDMIVDEYFVDLIIQGRRLIELKTVSALTDAHRVQCTNYLKATGPQLRLPQTFGKPRLEIKRVANGL